MAAIPKDLLDEFRDMKRRLRALEGRANIRPALNEVVNGEVVIGEGGEFHVRDPLTGVGTLEVGDLFANYGDTEFGVIIRRRDGSEALRLWNGVNPDQPQVLRLLDAQGNEIFSDDVTAGGLARPYLPYPDLADNDIARWPSTTSTSWTILQQGEGFAQHPRVQALISRDGGSGGEIRLLINDVVVATSSGIIQTIVEVPNYTFGGELNFKLEARLTGSATTVWARTRYLYGVPSA